MLRDIKNSVPDTLEELQIRNDTMEMFYKHIDTIEEKVQNLKEKSKKLNKA